MSISHYPYCASSCYVGGRSEVILDNEIDSFNYCSICLTFQQATFSSVATTGNLTFKVVFKPFHGDCVEKCVCVTPTQVIYSRIWTVPLSVRFIEVSCVSTDDTDTGIPVTVTIQSLIQGHEKHLSKKECKTDSSSSCKSCCKGNTLSFPCPTYTSIVPNSAPASTSGWIVNGTNVAYLKKHKCGCGLLSAFQNEATLTQGSLTSILEAIPASTTVLNLTKIADNNVFVAGSATITLTPTNAGCPVFTIPITLTANPSISSISLTK